MKQKYLVTFTVGAEQRNNIDAAVKKVTLVSQSIHPRILMYASSCFQVRRQYNLLNLVLMSVSYDLSFSVLGEFHYYVVSL